MGLGLELSLPFLLVRYCVCERGVSEVCVLCCVLCIGDGSAIAAAGNVPAPAPSPARMWHTGATDRHKHAQDTGHRQDTGRQKRKPKGNRQGNRQPGVATYLPRTTGRMGMGLGTSCGKAFCEGGSERGGCSAWFLQGPLGVVCCAGAYRSRVGSERHSPAYRGMPQAARMYRGYCLWLLADCALWV
jgi:hypothetical protein